MTDDDSVSHEAYMELGRELARAIRALDAERLAHQETRKELEAERTRVWDAVIAVDAVEFKCGLENGGDLADRVERIGADLQRLRDGLATLGQLWRDEAQHLRDRAKGCDSRICDLYVTRAEEQEECADELQSLLTQTRGTNQP